ncbi:hypothetical protein RI367_004601 [Sorochytrium milnesiophthora]
MPQQAKKQKHDAESAAVEEEEMIGLPEELEQIEQQLQKVEEEYGQALLKLMGEFEVKKAPLYEKRRAELKKLKGFWLGCFMSHPQFGSIVTPDVDLPVLEALEDVFVTRDPASAATYTITFTFRKDNQYLAQPEIVVKVTGKEDEIKVDVVKAPKWKDGKDPTKPAKTAGDSKKGKKRAAEYNGLFSLFNEPTEEVADVFNILANEIFPQALTLFMEGQLAEDDDDDDDEEDDDDEDGDE